MASKCDISAVIPTWRRPAMLRQALEHLFACDPPPAEVFVHVDAGDDETVPMLEHEFAGRVRWMQSASTQGPGGGRNLLIREARYPLVASFDDDSWPADRDYFVTAARLMAEHEKAAVLAGGVVLRAEMFRPRENVVFEVSSFESGASVFRREASQTVQGFVPIQPAYGMEEADLTLQLLDAGWCILRVPMLRVHHGTTLVHYASREVNAAHITNTALLAFLRYPGRYWPLAVAQVLSRVFYAMRMGRWRGIGAGLASIPATCRRFAAHRSVVRAETVRRQRLLARRRGHRVFEANGDR